MRINVNVELEPGDTFGMSADEAAAAVLAALNGDTTDTCTAFISMEVVSGTAGAAATRPAPAETPA